ncbi:hypothetical protein [Streptomyces sp. NPDC001787]|uniref:hypothetical protein n=1 Tax=Streptomyces sp. NPDC001787 TaxID=3154523 RepID=UPI00332C1E25
MSTPIAQPAATAPGAGPSDDLVRAVRRYLESRNYRPGYAVPAGVIALRLHETSGDVHRALQQLDEAGVVSHRPDGSHGSAFYVVARPVPVQSERSARVR